MSNARQNARKQAAHDQHLVGAGAWGYVADNWWQTETGGPCLGTPICVDSRPIFGIFGRWVSLSLVLSVADQECPPSGIGVLEEALITCYRRHTPGNHIFIKTLAENLYSTLTFQVSSIKPWNAKGKKGGSLQ